MRILVCIPTYNEAENIEPFIHAVFKHSPPETNIIIVDDNSPDGTADIVERLTAIYKDRLHILKRPGKQGGASAFLQAFTWGIEHGYDAMLAMDADFSHDPKYIPLLINKLNENGAVLGSRLVRGGGIENRTFARNIISLGASLYCRFLLASSIKDWTGGYNLWSKNALQKIDLKSVVTRGYSFQIEMKYKALKAGCKITEAPIIFPDRKYGVSKMPASFFVKALIDVWRIKFICMSTGIKQFIKFGITGGLGTVTNLAIFFLCADILNLPEIPVSVGCFIIAGTQNYFLNHLWSFREYTDKTPVSIGKWAAFLSGSLLGLGVNIFVMETILANFFLPWKFIAQACGIAAGMIINFFISKLIIFGRGKNNDRQPKNAE